MEKRKIVLAVIIIVLSVIIMIGCGIYCFFGYSDNRALNSFMKFYQEFYEENHDKTCGEVNHVYDCGARLIKTDRDGYQLAIFDIREEDSDYCVGELHVYRYICGFVQETGSLKDVMLHYEGSGSQATVSYVDGKIYFDYFVDENRNTKEYSLGSSSFDPIPVEKQRAAYMQSEASSVVLLSGENFLEYVKSILDYCFLDNTDLQIDQIKYLNKKNLVQLDNKTKITGLQTENARYDVLPNGNLILSEILDKEINNEGLSNIFEQQGYRQVVGIGNNLFDSCKNLTQVVIPNGIQRIGANVINSNTSNINKIELPRSIREISDNAFETTKKFTVFSYSDVVKDYAIKKHINYIKGKIDDYSIEELRKNRKRKYIIEAYEAYQGAPEIGNSSSDDFMMFYMDDDEYPELLRYDGEIITLYNYNDGKVSSEYWNYADSIQSIEEIGDMQITYDRAVKEIKEIAKKGTFIKPTFKALQYTYEDLSKSLG